MAEHVEFSQEELVLGSEPLRRIIRAMRYSSTILEDQDHQLHTVEMHDSVLKAALDPTSYLIGTYGADDDTPLHEALLKSLLLSTHYVLRYIACPEIISPERAHRHIRGLESLWALLWRQRKHVLDTMKPGYPSQAACRGRGLVADLLLHYTLLHLQLRNHALPPSDFSPKVALYCWAFGDSPFISESLLHTLRLSICSWNLPGMRSSFFQQAIQDGVGVAEFMEHIFHELEADEVADDSLVKLMEFIYLSISSYPQILEEKATIFLRCVIAACQRQYCSGHAAFIWPVTRFTLNILAVLTSEPWHGRFSTWGSVASHLATGIITFKLVVFASRATLLAVMHGNGCDIDAIEKILDCHRELLRTDDWLANESFRPRIDIVILGRVACQETLDGLQDLDDSSSRTSALRMWRRFAAAVDMADRHIVRETPRNPDLTSGCAWRGCLCSGFTPLHPLRRCGQCRQALYCSRACQRKDWSLGGHSTLCCQRTQVVSKK